jgi:ribosomal-protein-alanine N-acetyltransferase
VKGTLHVRPFKPRDLVQVLEIERISFRRGAYPAELFLTYHALHPAGFLVAEKQGHIVGYAVGRIVGLEGELVSIAVRPELRRRGVGSALWTGLCDFFQRAGVKAVRLHVRLSNLVARAFYTKLGFEERGIERRYYADGEDAIVMRLELKEYKRTIGKLGRAIGELG